MTSYATMEGPNPIDIGTVAHLLVPGRGHSYWGNYLSVASLNRTVFAAEFYTDQGLEAEQGRLVVAGDKTPADKNSRVPEAFLMKRVLLNSGIPEEVVSTEARSTDTVTSFARVEDGGHFPDERPVGIIAQEQHLTRIIKIIAPKTLRRDFLGIVVPEPTSTDPDSLAQSLASRLILLGISPDSPRKIERTTRRSHALWTVVNGLRQAYALME